MENEFTCIKCGKTKPVHHDGGTGYAVQDDGGRVCYSCCAEIDQEYMRSHSRIDLYLCKGITGLWEVTNWPGTLRFPVAPRKGKHNIAGSRYDVWFFFACHMWHGVQYGEWTQICHCKRVAK
jgi:hypothetical protein